MQRRSLLASSLALPLLPACSLWQGPALVALPPAVADSAPPAPREFRAAWVATVANIDWPSRKGLSDEQQIAEMLAMLDSAKALGLNAIVLQVRTSADAFYPSTLEPWSEYLGGTQGQAPGYDPLARWLAEAHARGLELHAWLNPYRARQSQAKSEAAPLHVSRSQPDWVKRYGDQLWIDPGEPAAAAHTLAVCRDLLTRYAVDGLHIDDYFYPYPVQDAARQDVDFPDEPSWQRYREQGGSLERADWRRANVDGLVQALYALVRELRPAARVGISPFGLPRPDLRPEGIAGFSQYDKLYANVEYWLGRGWLDYLAPQLYWPRAQKPQAFEPLLRGWQAHNPQGRHVWPGLFTSRATGENEANPWPADEIPAQVALMRQAPATGGHLHFSMVALLKNRRGLADTLRTGAYAQPALVPATPWLSAPACGAPRLERAGPAAEGRFQALPGPGATPRVYALWHRPAHQAGAATPPAAGASGPGTAPPAQAGWQFQVLPPDGRFTLPGSGHQLVLSAVNELGQEGPRLAVQA